MKSFYCHKTRTRDTSEADISDSIIARKIAHAIINYYFIVKPPEQVREMIAIYVDSHLQD